MKDLRKHMKICENLAAQAATKGNAPVGSIILKGHQIIAEAEEAGQSKKDITCHAEIEVLHKARKKIGADMSGYTLISTHEPCVMCGYAIRFHKISTVVYKESVRHLGSVSSTMKVLETTEVSEHWSKAPEIIHFKP